MDELEDQLRRLADHRADEVGPVTTPAVPSPLRPPLPRRWLVAAAVLAVALAGGVLVAVNRDDTSPVSTADPDTTAGPSTTTSSPTSEATLFESELGFTLDLPTTWREIEPDLPSDVGPYGPAVELAGPDDSFLLVTGIDRPNRQRFTDTIPDPLPTLAEAAEELAANFPTEFGTDPTVEPTTLDGRAAFLVRPSDDGLAARRLTVLTTAGESADWRFLEFGIHGDTDAGEAVLATLRWTDSASGPDADVFESRFGFTLTLPTGWRVEVDETGTRFPSHSSIVELLVGPGGESVRVSVFDQGPRDFFIDSVPDPLPTPATVIAELVSAFPAEFGATPTINALSIGGNEGYRIVPSAGAEVNHKATLVVTGSSMSARFVEFGIYGETGSGEAILDTLRWIDADVDPPACANPSPPGDVNDVGAGLVYWREGGEGVLQMFLADGMSTRLAFPATEVPQLLAAGDVDGRPGDELFVSGPGPSASAPNTVVLTLDGCELLPLTDDTGEMVVLPSGMTGGGDCTPAGCVGRVTCLAPIDGVRDIHSLVLGSAEPKPGDPSPDVAVQWESSVYRPDPISHRLDIQQPEPLRGELRLDEPPPAALDSGFTVDCSDPAPTSGEVAFADAFVAWAAAPSGAPPLPLADEVVLSLGPETTKTVAAADLADPTGWVIEQEYFAGRSGPFSALDVLAESVGHEVTIGAHWHCASPPWPEPAELFGLRRISIQATGVDSCIFWYAVDLFLDDEGRVRGITLELFEP